MNVAQETLGFRRQRFARCLSLLMSAFALPIPPVTLSSHLQRPTERSPTVQESEVRGQKSKTATRPAVSNFDECLAASAQSPGTRRANVATLLDRCTRDRDRLSSDF